MKKKKNELDVDFIGGQVPLTDSEAKALSEFFQKKKVLKKRPVGMKGKIKNSSSKS